MATSQPNRITPAPDTRFSNRANRCDWCTEVAIWIFKGMQSCESHKIRIEPLEAK